MLPNTLELSLLIGVQLTNVLRVKIHPVNAGTSVISKYSCAFHKIRAAVHCTLLCAAGDVDNLSGIIIASRAKEMPRIRCVVITNSVEAISRIAFR